MSTTLEPTVVSRRTKVSCVVLNEKKVYMFGNEKNGNEKIQY